MAGHLTGQLANPHKVPDKTECSEVPEPVKGQAGDALNTAQPLHCLCAGKLVLCPAACTEKEGSTDGRGNEQRTENSYKWNQPQLANKQITGTFPQAGGGN